MDDLISRQTATKAPEEPTRTFVELVVEYPDPELCTYKEYKGKPYYSIKYIENGETHIGYGTYKPEVLSQFLKEYFISSAQPEPYKEKLNEIANALSEKFAYMNTCLNERDIILGYLGVKRSCEIHCYTDCTNTKCESHPSFAQPDIIRCKDCAYMTEHYDTDGNIPYWTCSEWDSGTDYDGFCHYAERKEGTE